MSAMNRKQREAIQNRQDLKHAYEHFLNTGETEAVFEVYRPDRTGRFFSKAALDHLGSLVVVAISGLMLRRYNQSGKTPTKVRITTRIEFED